MGKFYIQTEREESNYVKKMLGDAAVRGNAVGARCLR